MGAGPSRARDQRWQPMTSRGVQQREDSRTRERSGAWARCGRPRQVRAGALVATRSVFPRAPSGVDLARGVKSLLGCFCGEGAGEGWGGGMASRGRDSQSQAEAHPRLSPAPRGATCSVRFGSARTARALFRSACAVCKIWPRVFAVASTPVGTDDKSSAKWLLERTAEQGERRGRVKVT